MSLKWGKPLLIFNPKGFQFQKDFPKTIKVSLYSRTL